MDKTTNSCAQSLLTLTGRPGIVLTFDCLRTLELKITPELGRCKILNAFQTELAEHWELEVPEPVRIMVVGLNGGVLARLRATTKQVYSSL